MSILNFYQKRRSATDNSPSQKSAIAAEQPTFILEPILTPSGILDDSSELIVDLTDPLVDEVDIPEVEDTVDATLPELELGDEEIEDLPFITLDDVAFAASEPTSPTFESGVFTVGETGEVSIDFLFDGGGYQGELAIFSLEGMESLEPGSEAFIQEAASRALSDSELGHVVISDRTEGARFSGELGESDRNSGDYLGVKTFQMNSGDEFGFMLVPKGEVEDVFENPAIGGAKRPLFSMATANPEDAFHVGQLADVNGDGNTFVIEDLRVDGKSDGDYNDLIFQVKGATATGEEVLLEDVIAEGKDWRDTEVGQELIEYTVESIKPTVTLTATDADAAESGDSGEFVITRTGDTKAELIVNYSVAGTATNGDDYNTLTGTAIIPEGSNTVTIPITVIDDAALEGDETVTISLVEDSAYKLGNTTNDLVTITDNDDGSVIDLATDLGLVDEPIQVSEGVWFLGEGIHPDDLRIDQPTNINAADTTNTNQLWNNGGLGLDLDGEGLTVGVWEATEGATNSWRIRNTHQELNGRVNIVDSGTGFSNHATHVGGTIAATGVDPTARGMANQINLRSYSSANDIAELDRDASLIVASNHSYSLSAGWTRASRPTVNTGLVQNTDVWLQDYSTSPTEDTDFGKYTSDAQALDQVLFDNPNLLSVWAAGNDRNDVFLNRSGNNTYVTFFGSNPNVAGFNWTGSGWYQVATNVIAPPGTDGNGETGYDTLSPDQVAKNTLVVGAIRDITADPYNSSNVNITGFSSWGPTDDGRIKPDVVANGDRLWSSGADANDDYNFSSGTSMAAPNVTGTAALLIEHYQNLFDQSPRSATTKGLLIHTAFDAGNVGPDYTYGWGLVDAAAAATFLTNAGNSSNWLEEGKYRDKERIIDVESDGTEPLKVTIAWTDPAGTPQDRGLDVNTPVLVNNLELWITGPDGTTYYPWTLDPANPANPAVRNQANNLDNVEQVLIDAPNAGKYQIHIGHKGSAFEQDYSLLVSGTKNFEAGNVVDLSGKSFNVVEEPRDAGDSFTTEFEIQNTQADSSGSFDVDFYISTNDFISTSDRYLGSYLVGNVSGNSSTGTLNKTLTLPSKGDPFWDSLGDDTYYIGMIVDGDGDVAETNESNNQNTGEFQDYDGVQINDTKLVINAWSWSNRFDDFTQQISDRWDQDYNLVDVERGDGRWFGVFGPDNGANAYSSSGNFDTFTQQISDRWDADYNLIDVDYGDGRWFGVFGPDNGANAYSSSGNFDTFTQQISDRWDANYNLVDVEYGDGRWFGVFGPDNGANAYSSSGNFDTFTQQISDRWDADYNLIDVEYGDGRWFGVFGPDNGANAYSSSGNFDTFTEQISDRWDEGLELVDVGYGDGRWFGVFQDD